MRKIVMYCIYRPALFLSIFFINFLCDSGVKIEEKKEREDLKNKKIYNDNKKRML